MPKGKKIFYVDPENCIQTIVQLANFGKVESMSAKLLFLRHTKRTSQEKEFSSVLRILSTRSQNLQNNDETSFILK